MSQKSMLLLMMGKFGSGFSKEYTRGSNHIVGVDVMKFNKEKINVVNIQQVKKSVFATGVGNAMEWFDFALYSYLAVIISQNFFSPVQNDELKLIFTFATFAIAFLLRPVGGIIFGKIGDKFGRKIVLTTTILMMA